MNHFYLVTLFFVLFLQSDSINNGGSTVEFPPIEQKVDSISSRLDDMNKEIAYLNSQEDLDVTDNKIITRYIQENRDLKNRIQIVKQKNGQYHLRVIAKNGRTLIWSEGYKDKRNVIKLISLLNGVNFSQEPVAVDESIIKK